MRRHREKERRERQLELESFWEQGGKLVQVKLS